MSPRVPQRKVPLGGFLAERCEAAAAQDGTKTRSTEQALGAAKITIRPVALFRPGSTPWILTNGVLANRAPPKDLVREVGLSPPVIPHQSPSPRHTPLVTPYPPPASPHRRRFVGHNLKTAAHFGGNAAGQFAGVIHKRPVGRRPGQQRDRQAAALLLGPAPLDVIPP